MFEIFLDFGEVVIGWVGKVGVEVWVVMWVFLEVVCDWLVIM